jgi:hypothetical protein
VLKQLGPLGDPHQTGNFASIDPTEGRVGARGRKKEKRKKATVLLQKERVHVSSAASKC